MSLKNTITAALTSLALLGLPLAQAEGSSSTPTKEIATIEYTQTQAKAVQYVLKRNSKLATLLHQYPSAHSDQFWTEFGNYLESTDTNAKVAEIIATSGDCNEFRPKNFKTLPKKEKRHFIKNPTPDYKECKELYRPRLNAKVAAKETIHANLEDANLSAQQRIAELDKILVAAREKTKQQAEQIKALAALRKAAEEAGVLQKN